MSLRPRDAPPRGTYLRDHFHGRYFCLRCRAECDSWQGHSDYHDALDAELAELRAVVETLTGGGVAPVTAAESMGELAARARAEGAADLAGQEAERRALERSHINTVAAGWREAVGLLAADWRWARGHLGRGGGDLGEEGATS